MRWRGSIIGVGQGLALQLGSPIERPKSGSESMRDRFDSTEAGEVIRSTERAVAGWYVRVWLACRPRPALGNPIDYVADLFANAKFK